MKKEQMYEMGKQPLLNKGFTLIELLAVIVILAIIALIATPIILNIIKDSQEEARERSIDNIIHAARIYATKEGLEENEAVHIKDISNMIDGEKPEKGIIYFNKKGEVAFSLGFKEYEVYVKSFEGEVEKTDQTYYLKKVNGPIQGSNSEENINLNKVELFLYNPYNITKEQVGKIITLPTNKVPEGFENKSWDVTNIENSGKVIAWYEEYKNELGEDRYIIYIGQTGGVKANVDSSYLFLMLINLEKLDLTYLNTSYVENMSNMFADVYSLTTIDVSNFDTANVNNMLKLFGANSSNVMALNKIIGLENFNTTNVTTLRTMFQNCTNLIEIDVSSFNTSKVENMRGMFAYLPFGSDKRWELMKLERIIGLENFNTVKVTTMRSMFQNCSNLTTLDLGEWDTSNVTDMSYMFNGTTNLKPIYIGEKWKTASTTDYMFDGTALTKSVDEMCGPNSTHEWCVLQ